MKRDLDLARQLLLDIENHGPDCSLATLRGEANGAVVNGSEDRARYHLRLLIDAGLVKEIDHTTAGVPCVRLTHNGHELLDLARADERWEAVKRSVFEATGGLSLTVIKAVLTKWAAEGASRGERRYTRVAAPYRPVYAEGHGYRPYYHRIEPRRRYEGYRHDYREPVYRDGLVETDELRLVRTRPDYREPLEPLAARSYAYSAGYATDRFQYDTETIDTATGVTVPVYLV